MIAGEPGAAEPAVRSAIATYEVATPTPRSRRNLAMAYETLAEVQKRTGKPKEALASCRHSLAISEALLADDPKNSQFAIDVVQEKVLLIDLLLAAGERSAARTETARLLAHLSSLVTAQRPSLYYLASYLAVVDSTPFPEFWKAEDAIAIARKAVDMTRGADPESLDLLARAYGRAGNLIEAVATEQKAIALLPAAKAGRPVPETRRKLEATLRELEQQSASARTR